MSGYNFVLAMISKREVGFFALIAVFALAVSAFAFSLGSGTPLVLATRLLALNGYIALAVAAIITAFLKEITLFLKKSFIKIHHYLAIAGLILITAHPIAFIIQTQTPSLLFPNTQSLFLFFYYGGSPALILVYIALIAALLRTKIIPYWRYIHALLYVALFFGVVHANLIGQDFQNIVLGVIYDALFAAVIAAFALKRYQYYRLKARVKKARLMAQANNKGSK
jgi:DMSO/TMAO reductase YedYZ heme-binding membrane subunit